MHHQNILASRVTPTVYRTNAFRLLGMPVTASATAIRRHAESLEQALDLGLSVSPARRPLPLDEPPDRQAIRDAVHRLRDPEQRLIEELFWFWPLEAGDGRSDPALDLLSNLDHVAASNLWKAAPIRHVGIHNLAVLAHAKALDLELRRVAASFDDERTALWHEALGYWQRLIDDKQFAQSLAERARAMDDPRVTEDTARRIINELAPLLLSINAGLASQALDEVTAEPSTIQRGPIAEAAVNHAEILQRSTFPPALATAAWRTTLDATLARLRSAGDLASAAATEVPAQADRITSQYLDEAIPLLALFDAPIADVDLREIARDEVARRGLTMLGLFHEQNESTGAATEHSILARLKSIAASEQATSAISEILARSEHYLKCWFCLDREPERASTLGVPLVRTHDGERAGLPVPRCSRCQKRHGWSEQVAGGVFYGSVIPLLWLAWRTADGPGDWAAILLGGMIQAWFLAMSLATIAGGSIKDVRAARLFPLVLEQTQAGWKLQ